MLAPAQRTADEALAFSREHLARVQSALANADQLATVEQQVKSLTDQNEQLTAQLRAESAMDGSLSLGERDRVRANPELTSPSFNSHLPSPHKGRGRRRHAATNVESLPACILGQSAQSFLRRARCSTLAPARASCPANWSSKAPRAQLR